MTSERDGDSAATRTTVPAEPEAARSPESTLDMPQAAAAAAERPVFARPRDPERYQVIAEHGRGGLGRVTRVHDRELGRDIAIKELLARNPLREVRFLREALITARLEHPGIVPVHEAGRWPDGTPFYAMKLVSGRPLRELSAERSAEDRIDLLHHVIAVADAIAYAHDRNIIHRDLKPANVIVGDFGETVVIDWGLAKDLTAPESSNDGQGQSPAPRGDELTEAHPELDSTREDRRARAVLDSPREDRRASARPVLDSPREDRRAGARAVLDSPHEDRRAGARAVLDSPHEDRRAGARPVLDSPREDRRAGARPVVGTPRHDGLTEAGAVLGTPAYMSPEQLRGAQVDQRTDVFAIGVMLWELCTTEPLALVEPERRRLALRRAGLDEDLITIITHALAPDPAHRYRDAGVLAADLKAFKSGARIAARRYSPLAVLAHWIRRHRAIAATTAAVVALGAAAAALYIRNIAIERDRADAALVRVETTQSELSREHAELTLKHAQLLLTSDPTAALDVLATYHGADQDRARQLAAEAKGRGVAVVRATPHTDNVLWLAGMPDGSVLSAGLDGTIARTVDGRSSVIANDLTPGSIHGYAPSRHLFVYLCHATALCMLDLSRGAPIALTTALSVVHPVALALSPSGRRLALLSRGGGLQIFDITEPTRPLELRLATTDRGEEMSFAGEDAVVVDTPDGAQLVRMSGVIQTLPARDCDLPYVDPAGEVALFVAPGGDGLHVQLSSPAVVLRQPLCHGAVHDVRFVVGQQLAAYSCDEGTVGLWDLARRTATARMHLDGHATLLTSSADGNYLLAAGSNGVIAVLDRSTDLVTYDRGHEFRLTSLAAPTRDYPYVLSGDVRGGIRAWPLPTPFARLTADLHHRFVSAFFNPETASIVATALLQPSLVTFSPSGAGQIKNIEPHLATATFTRPAQDGERFATYGLGDTVELWSASTMTRSTVLDTHHGSVSEIAFVVGTDQIFTSGEDGKLVRWTPAGEAHVVAQLGRPVTEFALLPTTRLAVVGTADGVLWRVTDDGHIAALRTGPAKPLIMRSLPDGTSLFVGYADGEVVVIDTRSGLQARLVRAVDAIQDIVVAHDGRTIAVAANDGTVRIGVLRGDSWVTQRVDWVTLTARARKLALTSDGLLVAVCTDGIIWLWSSVHRTWLCLPTGTDPSTVIVPPDGKTAVALDNKGRIISIDLETARTLLAPAR